MKSTAILIPSYNSSGTLRETLESLLRQETLASVCAVYLADDGSSDDSIALARSIWNGPPLRIIARPQNVGQWPNVNAAIREMGKEADWICILHADDMAKPTWLTELFACIESADDRVGSICSSWDNLEHDGSISPGETNLSRGIETITGTDQSVRDTLLRGCWWHISGCAIRTAAFVDTGDFSDRYPYMADWEWLLRSLARGWEVLYIPQSLIVYRLQGASVSGKAFRAHLDISESLDVFQKHIRYLSVRDLLGLHLIRAVALLKRLATSVIRFHPARAARAIALLVLMPWRIARCLFVRMQQTESSAARP